MEHVLRLLFVTEPESLDEEFALSRGASTDDVVPDCRYGSRMPVKTSCFATRVQELFSMLDTYN